MIKQINSLKVGPMNYAVKEVERLLAENGITKLNGWVRFDQVEILVDADLAEQRKMLVVMHEAMHAIFENAGKAEEEGEDENLIDVLARGVMGLIIDNPQLVAWLTGNSESISV